MVFWGPTVLMGREKARHYTSPLAWSDCMESVVHVRRETWCELLGHKYVYYRGHTRTSTNQQPLSGMHLWSSVKWKGLDRQRFPVLTRLSPVLYLHKPASCFPLSAWLPRLCVPFQYCLLIKSSPFTCLGSSTPLLSGLDSSECGLTAMIHPGLGKKIGHMTSPYCKTQRSRKNPSLVFKKNMNVTTDDSVDTPRRNPSSSLQVWPLGICWPRRPDLQASAWWAALALAQTDSDEHTSCVIVMWITYTFIPHEWLRQLSI